MLGWVLFRSDSISGALVYIRFMFVFGCKGFIDAMCIQYFKQNTLYYIMEILCCMPVFKNIDCIFFKNVVYNAIEPSSITSNKKSGKKVLLIGDSFSKHMNDIMSLYFSEVHTVNVWSFTTDQLNQYRMILLYGNMLKDTQTISDGSHDLNRGILLKFGL